MRFSLKDLLLHVAILGLAYGALLWSCTAPRFMRKLASPDGKHVASMWMHPRSIGHIDYNFWFTVGPPERTIYTSHDQQSFGETFLWTTDSRHLLVVGCRFIGMDRFNGRDYDRLPKTTLTDGSRIFLLFDTATGVVKCNAPTNGEQPFTTDDLARLTFSPPLGIPPPGQPEPKTCDWPAEEVGGGEPRPR